MKVFMKEFVGSFAAINDQAMDAARYASISLEEKLIKQIMFQLLGREITADDAKYCTKYYEEGEPLNYELGYKSEMLGKVKFTMEGSTLTITFNPYKIFK